MLLMFRVAFQVYAVAVQGGLSGGVYAVDVQGGLSGFMLLMFRVAFQEGFMLLMFRVAFQVYAVAVLPNCWQSVVTSPGESGPLR